MKEMEAKGIIKTKDEKGVSHVISIDRTHEECVTINYFYSPINSYTSFRPIKAKEEEPVPEDPTAPTEIPLQIIELVKPPSGLIPMFAESGKREY
jgi:hypothetical protein